MTELLCGRGGCGTVRRKFFFDALTRLLIAIALCLVLSGQVRSEAPASSGEQARIESVAEAQSSYGEGSALHLHALAGLVQYYDQAQQQHKALRHADRYTQLLATSMGARSPEARLFQRDLVRRYLLLGDRAGAANAFERHVVALRDGSERDRDLADAEHTLALLFADAGRPEAAEAQFAAAVAALSGAYGGEHRMVAAALLDWSRVDALLGGGRQSEKLRDKARAILARGDARAGYRPELANNQTVRRLEDELDRALRAEGFASEAYLQRLMALGQHYEKIGYTGGALRVAQRSLSLAGLWLPDDAPFQEVLLDMAHKYAALEEHEDALRAYRRYREVLVRLYGDGSPEAARAGYDIAVVLAALSRFEAAAAEYEQAVPRLQAALGSRHPQAGLALAHWSGALSHLGDHEAAAAKAESAWAILGGKVDLPAEQLLSALTVVRQTLHDAGRHDLAVVVGEAALARARAEFGDADPRIGAELNDLAVFANAAGRYADALRWAEDSVARLSRSHGADHPLVATALSTLAEAYAGLGRQDKARELMERSLAIKKRHFGADSVEVARTQLNLALLLDDVREAIRLMALSQKVIERHGTPREEVALDLNLATAYAQAGDFRKAADLGRDSLRALQSALPDWHAEIFRARVLLGMIQVFKDEPEQAIVTLHEALARVEPAPATTRSESLAQMMLCLAYAYQGQEDLSIIWGKQAVNSLQQWRSAQAGLAPMLRESLTRRSRQTFEMVATLLVKQGRIDEAQQIVQMLKEEELFRTLRGAGGDPRQMRIGLTAFESEIFSPYFALREQQGRLAAEHRAWEQEVQTRLLGITESKRPEPPKPAAAQLDMQAFLKRLETDQNKAPGKATQNAASLRAEATALRRAVDELARSEPKAGAVGIQYIVSADTLNIIVTPPGAPAFARQLPIKRDDLYRDILAVQMQVGNPASDVQLFRAPLRKLYALLIGSVRAELDRLGARTLMLSLDSRLRLLPFAALMDESGHYLVQDYAIALYNEASGRTLGNAAPPAFNVVAMGLSESVDGLPALRHVPNELARVASTGGQSGAVYLNGRFNRQRWEDSATSKRDAPFNVLHVASHFRFSSGQPAASWLYFGDKSHLTLAEMAESKAELSGFDLVTYSACETAKGGGREAHGEEMESLGAITQRKGAQAVLATLWKVADASTAELMASFYRNRAESRLNKAQAMRTAQLSMIEGKGESHRWRHPYYWAPFVVMGNWR